MSQITQKNRFISVKGHQLNKNIESPPSPNDSIENKGDFKSNPTWKMIIADDEEEIHRVTKMIFKDYTYDGRELELLSAYSAKETNQLVLENPDTAVIILDVVMETDTAGFEVVQFIREKLNNNIIQIILRTGQTGKVPEHKVIVEYAINDFKSKTELTARKLTTSVTSMLRNYQLANSFHELNKKLKKELVERKRIEKALKKSETRYRVLAETAREIIITFDFDGKITYINKYGIEISKYKAHEIEGMNISDFLLTHSIVSDNEEYYYEADFIDRSGLKIPVEVSSSLLMDEQVPSYMLVIARNITARKKAKEQAQLRQEQLFQADKMASLGTLVSGVAHEINNPITSVMLNAPILEKIWNSVIPVLDEHSKNNKEFSTGGMSYNQVRDRVPYLLSDITDGAKRVKSIVNDLKDFARQTPSEIIDKVDCNKVVEKAVGLVSNLIKKSTNHFLVNYGENLPELRGNIQRIEQVVINLLVNACQALQNSDQSICVNTLYDEGKEYNIIEVLDEGQGMPPEVLERIKDPFFTTKRNTGGTGLGLSISDRIIQDHYGNLEFVSNSGKGTTARILLPVHSNIQPGDETTNE